MFKNEKLDVLLLILLIALQLAGFYALLHHFQWTYLWIMIPMYLWMGFGTTLYMHRYLTHRGMEMPGWLKFFFAMSTSVGLSGDPVTWVGDHRYHHLKSDTDEDIHSPLHGFPYAHMLWMVKKPKGFKERSTRYASDVRKIWYCKLFENQLVYVLPHLAVALTLWFTLGPAGMLWCLYFPMMVLYNFTWAVNSICHLPAVGYRTFDTTDHSRNNFWVSLGALGEGFHNNHHAHPKCAAHGLRWWEIDLTKYLIWLLERCGLAWKVAWPKTEAAQSETEVKTKPMAAPAQGLLAKMMDPDGGLASASE